MSGKQYVTIVRTERITRVVEITLYIDPDELATMLPDEDFSPWEHYVVEDDYDVLEMDHAGPWEIDSIEVGQ